MSTVVRTESSGGTGSRVPPIPSMLLRGNRNDNQVWCVNKMEYVFFVSIVGSEYYAPPVVV